MTRVLGWLACAGAVALLIVAIVTGTAAEAADAAARVSNVAVRLAVVPGRPAAGYFTLRAGVTPIELTGVTSPVARVELHGMSMAGDVMRMDRLPSVRVAAANVLRFAPGGSHLMLFNVAAGVRPGATLPLTFAFADGTSVRVAATVTAGGGDTAMPPMHGPR